MEIRQLDGLELQQSFYIWSQAFEHGDSQMEEWHDWEARVPGGRTTYGIFDDAGLQAVFMLGDEQCYLGDRLVVPVGGVDGVAVLPASRGKGYAGIGMRYLLERMRERGQALSMLIPFSWEFYRRLGYEWIAPTRRYTVPTRILEPSPETQYVRACATTDHPAIIACYEQYARRYRGMVKRRDVLWPWFFDRSRKKETYLYCYERNGQIEGYLLHEGLKKEETLLEEFTALTVRAQRGLLGLLRRHEMQVDKFTWNAPTDDSLWSLLYHWDIKTQLRTRHMGRIVDVPAALSAWHPQNDMTGEISRQLVLSVQDEAAPWNHGRWEIEVSGGDVQVSATQREPQVTLDIQALTQAYLGALTAKELCFADRLSVQDEAGFDTFCQLMSGPPAWCNDGF